MKNISNFNKQFLTIFQRNSQSIYYENPIIALLKGPDARYEEILMNENEQLNTFKANDRGREKNSFLQIHIRPLNAKQQRRLLKKQYRQLSKRYCQSAKTKNKCLQFTFPITYPCPMKSKRKQPSISSNSLRSSKQSTSQLSNDINRLKSAVSILFTDDKTDGISKYKNPLSSSLLNISSNAYRKQDFCSSILSNDICSCIIQNLLKLNNTKKENYILV